MKKYVTIRQDLQNIKSSFESGINRLKCVILEREGNIEYNIGMGFTSHPVEIVKDDDLITSHDYLEENVYYAVSEFFHFEVDVYLSDGCIIIEKI